jgi:hypothetical protein
MRLLNVHTLQLEDFTERYLPRYSILSHRWGDDEVSHKEFRKGSNKTSAGYRKIVDFCALVKRSLVHIPRKNEPRRGLRDYSLLLKDPVDWVWIDTCKGAHTMTIDLYESTGLKVNAN